MASFISQNLTEIEAVTGCTFLPLYDNLHVLLFTN